VGRTAESVCLFSQQQVLQRGVDFTQANNRYRSDASTGRIIECANFGARDSV
jgi:hypothetical protein